jgi:D-threo-aldose 1-dehydrogenase
MKPNVMKGTPLPTREIGRTRLRVSELGLGTAALGNLYERVSDQDAQAIIAEALDHGVAYIDTAPYYGFGLSERRVGDALRERHGIVLSTKVGRLLRPDALVSGHAERHGFRSPMRFKPVYDYGYEAILRSHEDSIQRLGLARIDILYIHDIGSLTHGGDDAFHFDALTRGGGLRALEQLRESGAIGAFGVGVNEVEACLRVMDHASLDVILLAGRYTLLEQGAHTTLFPKCAQVGTSVIIGAPYNSGILATGVRQNGTLHYEYNDAPANVIERVGAIEEICASFNVPLAAAALQFPLAHPAVVSVIPGIDNPRRVAQTINLYRTPVPVDLWSALQSRGLIDASAPIPSASTTE